MHLLPVKSTTKDQVSAQNQYRIEPTRQSALEAPPEANHRATTQSAFLLPVDTPSVSEMSTIEARRHLEQLESEARRLKAQLTGLQRKYHADRRKSTDGNQFSVSEPYLLESAPTQGQALQPKSQPNIAQHYSTTQRLLTRQDGGQHQSYDVITGPTYGPDRPKVMMSPFATTAD